MSPVQLKVQADEPVVRRAALVVTREGRRHQQAGSRHRAAYERLPGNARRRCQLHFVSVRVQGR